MSVCRFANVVTLLIPRPNLHRLIPHLCRWQRHPSFLVSSHLWGIHARCITVSRTSSRRKVNRRGWVAVARSQLSRVSRYSGEMFHHILVGGPCLPRHQISFYAVKSWKRYISCCSNEHWGIIAHLLFTALQSQRCKFHVPFHRVAKGYLKFKTN